MTTSADNDAAFIATAMPAFISEASEQTQAIEGLLLELEGQPGNRELMDSLFRCAHTVKGSAGIFGLEPVVEFTHHVETLLDKMRDGLIGLTPDLNTLLLRCNDHIKLLVQASSDPAADTPATQQERVGLVAQLRQLCGEAVQATAAPAEASGAGVALHAWTITARFGEDTFRNGMDPISVLRYLAGMGTVRSVRCLREAVPALGALEPETCYLGFTLELHTREGREAVEGAFSFVLDDCQLDVQGGPMPAPDTDTDAASPEATAPPAHAPADMLPYAAAGGPEAGKPAKLRDAPAGAAEESRYIRVQADRLDAVINLLGELVIAGAGAMLKARASRDTELVETNLHMNRLIEEIRNGTLGLRMVPVGETFNRFRRVVRDTASHLGKEVSFEIVGGDAELDKSMVEKIADPLMHLVRNALDHGLETPSERVAAGKPAEGKLVLSAHHETGAILIRIEDDGRGINRDKVLQRAWSRGLVEQGVVPSTDAIHMLIFEPGFSTADQVTNLSGRGVGMDVVRRNIESLRGTIKLDSIPGHGLRVDIRLPLTLAIIDGFLVGIGKSKFVLPLESVVEVIESGDSDMRVDAFGRYTVELRGQVLPVVRLRTLYALESSHPKRVSVVVVSSPRGQYGIEVDVLFGQNQTVIKPLGRLFKSLRGISGSSVLGSGEVALILDVTSLEEQTTQSATSPPRAEAISKP